MTTSAFEQCLQDLESGDQARRRRGAQQLAGLSDRRALQVTRALLSDPDEMVRFHARQALNALQEKGFKIRMRRESDNRKEYQYLFNPTQVVDEVLFIYKAAAGRALVASLKTGFGKIILFSAFFHFTVRASYTWRWQELVSVPALGALFLYSLFFRPPIWMAVGNAFLGGYQDRRARNLSRRAFSVNRLLVLAGGSCLKSILVVLIPGALAVGGMDNPLLAVAGALLFIFMLYKTAHILPLQLMTGSSAGEAFSRSMFTYARFGAVLRKLYPTFLFITAGFYLCLGYGLSIAWGWLFWEPGIFETGFLLLCTDILIEPFWIGFHILVTRCIMQMEAEHSVANTR